MLEQGNCQGLRGVDDYFSSYNHHYMELLIGKTNLFAFTASN